MEISTPDLCDAHADSVRVVTGLHWRHFGGRKSFGGRFDTVKCFEDNARVKEQLASRGDGKVLVVDGGGSLRHALLGDMIADKAVRTGWAGVVIFGACRDVEQLAGLDIGICALGCIPLKSVRRGEGQLNGPVRFGGVNFEPGEYVYVDENGIIVADRALIDDASPG